jgi:CubicO group peptidase (beta-lactamase class C family)
MSHGERFVLQEECRVGITAAVKPGLVGALLAGLTGLAVAILNDSRVVYTGAFGWKNKDDSTTLHDTTVFAGASLSKPVFAYLVSVLADQGILDLDRPLSQYLTKPLPDYTGYEDLASDRRHEAITARMALSHTTGLPNLRSLAPGGRLYLASAPGSRFSYSGEGFQLLQMVIEHITRADLETLAREHVFLPFRMRHTSFVWRSSFAGDVASPHNEFQWAGEPSRPAIANAAGSLTTTAGDYARFISGILSVRGRRGETVDAMLAPVVRITTERMFGPGTSKETTDHDAMRLSWALGWGTFHTPSGSAFFHTGHASGAQNYVVAYREKGIGIVLLSNSDNFEPVVHEVVAAGIGETHSPFRWLGFAPFDSTQTRRPVPPRRVPVAVTAAIVAPYAGTYELGPGARTHLRADGARLFASDDGLSWDELFAESDSVFFLKGSNVTLTFIREATGDVNRIDIDADGTRITARRVR